MGTLSLFTNAGTQNDNIESGCAAYPEGSLGFLLEGFLATNNFEFAENGIFHVLTGIGTTISDEIGLQYYLLGNGKRSFYAVFYLSIGTLIYLHKSATFLSYFRKGKRAHRFYDLDLSKLLSQPVSDIQFPFNIK